MNVLKKNSFLNKFNFLFKYKFLIGLCIIIGGFLMVRLPYFIYAPITNFEGDSTQYYMILEYLERGVTKPIYYPAPGYSFFIGLIECIYDKTWFFVLCQSLVQLFAVLLFYFAYYKVFNKYVLFCSIVLFGYISSNANLHFDTSIFPDSLLSSCVIIFISLLIFTIKYKSNLIFYSISIVSVFALTIRPTSLSLIPVVIFILTLNFIVNKDVKWLVKQMLIYIALLFSFALFNFFSPLYKTFSLKVEYPKLKVDQIKVNQTFTEKIDNPIILKFSKIVPSNCRMKLIEKYNSNETEIDSIFSIYRYEFYRHAFLYIDSNSNLIYFCEASCPPINLDKIKFENIKLKKEYKTLKTIFFKKYGKKLVQYDTYPTLKTRLITSLYFFKYHFCIEPSISGLVGRENMDFYSYTLKGRIYGYFSSYNWNKWADAYMKTNFPTIKNNLKRTTKELYLNKTKSLTELNLIFWKMNSSRFYRRIIEPFYKVQPFLFRNILFPIVFCLTFFMCIYGLILSKFKSIFLWYFISICLLLFTYLFIHCIYFSWIYLRYTIESSFIYYSAMVLFPIIIDFLIHYRKTKYFKY